MDDPVVQQLVEDARAAVCTPAGLNAFAPRVPDAPDAIQAAARKLIAGFEPAAAAMVIFAGAVIGIRPHTDDVVELLPMVQDIRWMPLLVGIARGDRPGAVLHAIESGRLSRERECLGAFIITELTRHDDPAPRLLAVIRTLARQAISLQNGLPIGLAALATKDAATLQVAARWVPLAMSDPGRRLTEWVASFLAGPISQVFPEPMFADIAPARRGASKVGRNDPCPCGSGQKYKRCCLGKEIATTGADGPTAAHLDAQPRSNDTDALSAHEVARLDYTTLGTRALIGAVRKLTRYRFWDQAERAMDVLAGRTDCPGGSAGDDHREDLILDAIEARAIDVVHRQLAKAKDLPTLRERIALELALLEPRAGTLAVLDEHAKRGLTDPKSLADYDVAHALLDHAPALGVLVARSLINPSRELDSETLLHKIEEVRDQLQLPPGDPAATAYESLLERDVEERLTRQDPKGTSARNEAVAAETDELREKLRQAASRTAMLEQKLREQQARLASQSSPTSEVAATPSEDTDRLRDKIRELKGRIATGQAERAELRRELAEKAHQIEAEVKPSSPESEDEHLAEDEGEAHPLPRQRVLLPVLADRVQAEILRVSSAVGAHAMRVVGGLCSHDAVAWNNTKRLKARPDLSSARVGIHYRLLFRLDSASTKLTFLALVHRRDLELAIRQL